MRSAQCRLQPASKRIQLGLPSREIGLQLPEQRGYGVAAIGHAHQPLGQCIQWGRIQAVAEDLRPTYDPLLHIEMQLHPAPVEALVQLMGERRRMTKIPLPAALAGESVGKAGQVRQLGRGDMLGETRAP